MLAEDQIEWPCMNAGFDRLVRDYSFRSHGPHSGMQSTCSISAAFVQSIDLSCNICAAEMQEICSMNAVEVQYHHIFSRGLR
jgi:hypothetical protein